MEEGLGVIAMFGIPAIAATIYTGQQIYQRTRPIVQGTIYDLHLSVIEGIITLSTKEGPMEIYFDPHDKRYSPFWVDSLGSPNYKLCESFLRPGNWLIAETHQRTGFRRKMSKLIKTTIQDNVTPLSLYRA